MKPFLDWRTLLLASAMLAFSAAGAMAQNPAAAPASSAQALRLSSGDLIELSVFDCPEFSGKLRVSAAGEVAVPVAGPVKVSGLTAEEAAGAIEDLLRSHDVLKNPHATVFISEYATQGITVAGEVKNPGIYPLLGSHTLLDLISAAGGVTPRAGSAVTITHRSDSEHPEIVQINNEPGAVAKKLDILPGDTVTVSRAGIVYVVGEVGKPGGFIIESNDLTTLQALALAQGANKTANQNRSRLIRKTATGREEVQLPLKKILAGKAPDIPVHDGDIIFVPTNTGKNVVARTTESAIAITTGMIIYGKL
jgi:polysaccharide export outer membrane protein